MKLAAHQPHSFPWLGYLHRIASCDVFVLMDDLQFEAQNFQNRNKVKVNNGTVWLTVPLVKGPQSDRILDKRITEHQNPKEQWRRKTWLTLRTSYSRAPFFDLYAKELEACFEQPWERLVDFNLHMTQLCMRWLNITTPLVMASTLNLQGQRTDRIVDLCQRLGARTYLSGRGGSTAYLDLEAMKQAGIAVEWQPFEHPVYPQRYPELGFVPNLAALDCLFNCGPASRALLLQESANWSEHVLPQGLAGPDHHLRSAP